MTQIGFLMNLILPQKPWYLEQQPELQTRMKYSIPKNTTKKISWKENDHVNLTLQSDENLPPKRELGVPIESIP